MDTEKLLEREIEEKIIRAKDQKYNIQAYLFVIRALDILLEKIISETNARRHVTGRELATVVKDFALHNFGPTAKIVLEHWGIYKTDDIGKIVFDLIDIGILGKTKDDRLEDFCDVFDFEDEFVNNFSFSVKDKNYLL